MAAAKKSTKSTAVATRKSTAVVNIQEALRAQAAADAARTIQSSGKSIRIGQDKSFTLPDGTKTYDPLQLVVVDFVSRNMFYEGPYDPNNIAPPTCFSISPSPRGMVPSANAPEAQADACDGCPMNEFGSAPTGNGKACKNTRLLAVLPPDADEDTEIWTLSVSPTAIKNFDKFVADVNRIYGLPPIGVVVTVDFSKGSQYPSLEFSSPEPNANLESHYARSEEARELLSAEPDLTQKAEPARKAPVRRKAVARR